MNITYVLVRLSRYCCQLVLCQYCYCCDPMCVCCNLISFSVLFSIIEVHYCVCHEIQIVQESVSDL